MYQRAACWIWYCWSNQRYCGFLRIWLPNGKGMFRLLMAVQTLCELSHSHNSQLRTYLTVIDMHKHVRSYTVKLYWSNRKLTLCALKSRWLKLEEASLISVKLTFNDEFEERMKDYFLKVFISFFMFSFSFCFHFVDLQVYYVLI